MRILIAGALFATGGALIKSCDFPSLQRAGLRAAFAAMTIFWLLPAARHWPSTRVLRIAPAYFTATCCFVVANTLTTAANAIFLQSTAPLWLVVLGPLLVCRRIGALTRSCDAVRNCGRDDRVLPRADRRS